MPAPTLPQRIINLRRGRRSVQEIADILGMTATEVVTRLRDPNTADPASASATTGGPTYSDDFAVNKLASDYANYGNAGVSGGQLVPTTVGTDYVIRKPMPGRHANRLMQVKFIIPSTAGNSVVGLMPRYIDPTNWIVAQYEISARNLIAYRNNAGTPNFYGAYVTGAEAAPAAGAARWLRALMIASELTMAVYSSDPEAGAAPIASQRVDVSSDGNTFNALIAPDAGIRMVAASGDMRVDDFKIWNF